MRSLKLFGRRCNPLMSIRSRIRFLLKLQSGSLKRYLSGPEHRIQLSDLIASVVEQVVMATSGEGFEVQGGESPTIQSVTARIRKYDAACQTLLAMASTAGFWAEDDNLLGWERALERFYTTTTESDNSVWNTMKMYPGVLATYSIGLGAVESDRLDALSSILEKTIVDNSSVSNTTTVLFKLADGMAPFTALEGFEKSHAAINDWLHGALRQPIKSLIADDVKYSYVFDKCEMLVSLANKHSRTHSWMPLGSFIHRRVNAERILTEIVESIRVHNDDSPFVASGIFGENKDECMESIKHFNEYIDYASRMLGCYWWFDLS